MAASADLRLDKWVAKERAQDQLLQLGLCAGPGKHFMPVESWCWREYITLAALAASVCTFSSAIHIPGWMWVCISVHWPTYIENAAEVWCGMAIPQGEGRKWWAKNSRGGAVQLQSLGTIKLQTSLLAFYTLNTFSGWVRKCLLGNAPLLSYKETGLKERRQIWGY